MQHSPICRLDHCRVQQPKFSWIVHHNGKRVVFIDNAHSRSYRDSNAHSNSNSNTNVHSHSDTDTYLHSYSNSDTNIHSYTDSDTNAYAYSDGYTYSRVDNRLSTATDN